MTMPMPRWDKIDAMVDEDPLKLRDLAWNLVQRLEQLQPAREASGNALYLDGDGVVRDAPSFIRPPADWRPLYVHKEQR
jgi:hypothetical protein